MPLRGLKGREKVPAKKTSPHHVPSVALAAVITDAIEKGTFTLSWFEETNKPKARETQSAKPQTVGQYFRRWIERKKPPVIRKGLERDYREQFARYILPKFDSVPLSDVTPALLEAFRSYLLNERELSLKTVRNVIDATFRALWRDARKVDYLVDRDPFQALQCPRIPTARPDPFSEEERDAILAQFKAKVPSYFPFVHTLFWTGMRPSEALALRWGDVDLKAGYISISRSRYLDAEGSPKSAGSEREIRLLPAVVEVLKAAKPLHVTEKDLLFKNEEGEPLNFHTWRAKHWYRVLRAKGMRERKPYATRHTFISGVCVLHQAHDPSVSDAHPFWLTGRTRRVHHIG